MIFSLIGSLGLFLLGMWLLTEGLKLSGGRALESLLGLWTRSRQRGLLAGVLITGLVQSSSAVTVATIGFVNAGVLTFQHALWVVFGSNVGTTLTAWIVTFFGFSLNIDAITFPLIGVGAGLSIFSPYERGKAFGRALAGFGLLFMGIDALKDSFSGYANNIDVQVMLDNGGHGPFWGLVIGLLLTVVTQSSSAAIAIILTAVASEVAGASVAAAAVIGANIGTTSTALIATLGATLPAKRLAWAHVAFNAVTAVLALALLPLFWWLMSRFTEHPIAGGNLTLPLALFHTCFNVLGVILMWPLEPKLSRHLLSMYSQPPKQRVEMSHLDSNIATVPDLAIRALGLELSLLLDETGKLNLLGRTDQSTQTQTVDHLKQRTEQAVTFIAQCLNSRLTEKQGERLTEGLSVCHHLRNAARLYTKATTRYHTIAGYSLPAVKKLHDWLSSVDTTSHQLHHGDLALIKEHMHRLHNEYQSLKKQLLAAAVAEKAGIDLVDDTLITASLSRRYVEQVAQATSAFASFSAADSTVKSKPVPN